MARIICIGAFGDELCRQDSYSHFPVLQGNLAGPFLEKRRKTNVGHLSPSAPVTATSLKRASRLGYRFGSRGSREGSAQKRTFQSLTRAATDINPQQQLAPFHSNTLLCCIPRHSNVYKSKATTFSSFCWYILKCRESKIPFATQPPPPNYPRGACRNGPS